MRINSQNFNNKSLKFKGMYALRGTSSEVESARQMVIRELSKHNFDLRFEGLGTNEDTLTLGVATSFDVKHLGTSLFKESAQKRLIETSDLLSPTVVIGFNPLNGTYTKTRRICTGKTQFICARRLNSDIPAPDDNTLNIIKFKKPRSLLSAIKVLDRLPDKVHFDETDYIYFKGSLAKLTDNLRDIGECKELQDIKVAGLCGVGKDSVVLDLTDNLCLKLSFSPNVPLKDAIYDIPTIKKGIHKLRRSPYEESLYWAIQRRGLNTSEYRITDEHLEEVRKMILSTNPQSYITDFDKYQIALLDGRPYLVDAPVVMSRPFYELQ